MSEAIDHPERSQLDDEQGQVALRGAAGVVDLPRDVVRVTGADATSFLQGQVSQDVERLLPGSSAWSFVLQPTGKVDVWLRISRLDDAEFVLDVDAGFGDALIARLERFKLRVDCTFEPLSWRCVALRGPEVAELGPYEAVVAAEPRWPGVEGVDLLGPEVLVPAGIPTCPVSSLEALRIEAGVPRMGAELTEDTIPAASGIVERSVSFSKGCFTGQELVARIDSRGGNVPTRLVGVVLPGVSPPPPVGTPLLVDEEQVATLTSTATSHALGGAVGLAYLPRKVEVPGAATAGGFGPVELRALPLV
jgi:folate-binding protein YgfZ